MPLALPRFCAIIDRSLRPQLSLAELAQILTRAGVRLIQLRAKGATSQALLADARQLLSSLPADASLIVNDRADVALVAGAAGVHLGQQDLPAAAARALLGEEKIVGLSTHNLAEIEAGNAAPVDYLAFGPIFATATKADTAPVVGCAGLREARRATRKPLAAIGGITPENAGEVLEAGADSVAVIGGWLAPSGAGQASDDIAGRLEAFRRVLGRLD